MEALTYEKYAAGWTYPNLATDHKQEKVFNHLQCSGSVITSTDPASDPDPSIKTLTTAFINSKLFDNLPYT